MNKVCIGIALGGLLMIYLGWGELQITWRAGAEPQTMTCEELLTNGPGNNAHVLLSDVAVLDFLFVTENWPNSKDWKQMWIALVPRSGVYYRDLEARRARGDKEDTLPLPDGPVLILRNSKIKSAAELREILTLTEVQGIVFTGIASTRTNHPQFPRSHL